MRDFCPGLKASAVHSSLKTAVRTMDQAQNNALLWFREVRDRQLFKEFGHSSMNQYAMNELGFSKTKCGDFMNLCNKLKKLPKVEKDVLAGKLGYTSARELVKVADQNNEDQWLETARQTSRQELAGKVKKAKRLASENNAAQASLLPPKENQTLPKASPPTRVTLEMSALQRARFEKLWEKGRKLGCLPSDRAEALLVIMEYYAAQKAPRGAFSKGHPTENKEDGSRGPEADENGTRPVEPAPATPPKPAQPPTQIHIHLCPDCQKAAVQTGLGELVLKPSELEQARCDCVIQQHGQPNRKSIAPATRREALTRDRHTCQRPGCGHTQFLEIHHILPRSKGGTNDTANLVTVCSTCHRLLHEHKWSPGGFLVKSREGVYEVGEKRRSARPSSDLCAGTRAEVIRQATRQNRHQERHGS